MPRELKILLFAVFALMFGLSFIMKLWETRSALDALLFVGQLALLFIVVAVLFMLFLWVGSKIFRE